MRVPLAAENNIAHLKWKQDPAKWADMQNDVRDACHNLLVSLRMGFPGMHEVETALAEALLKMSAGRLDEEPVLELQHTEEDLEVWFASVAGLCPCHMLPVTGKVYVGFTIGEQKQGCTFGSAHEVLTWNFNRPRSREEASAQVLDTFASVLAPAGSIIHCKLDYCCAALTEGAANAPFTLKRGTLETDQDLDAAFFRCVSYIDML